MAIPDILKALPRSRIAWTLLIVNTIFWFCAWLLDRHDLSTMASAVSFPLALMAAVAYAPGAIWTIVRGHGSGTQILILGIFGAWAFESATRLWVTLFRISGRPPEMIDHPILSWMLLMSGMAAIPHILSAGSADGEAPQRTWIRIGLWTAAFAAAGIMLLYVGLNLQ